MLHFLGIPHVVKLLVASSFIGGVSNDGEVSGSPWPRDLMTRGEMGGDRLFNCSSRSAGFFVGDKLKRKRTTSLVNIGQIS